MDESPDIDDVAIVAAPEPAAPPAEVDSAGPPDRLATPDHMPSRPRRRVASAPDWRAA